MKTFRFFPFTFALIFIMLASTACRTDGSGNSTHPTTPTAVAELNNLPASTKAPQPTAGPVKADTAVPTQPKTAVQPTAAGAALHASATPDQSADDLLKALDDLDAANQKGDALPDLP